MTAVQRSVRLSLALDKAMVRLAAQHQFSPYQMLQQCVRKGLVVYQNAGSTNETDQLAAMTRELAGLGGQIAANERIAERALYVACAAYVCARAAAQRQNLKDEQITQETEAAFARQLKQTTRNHP